MNLQNIIIDKIIETLPPELLIKIIEYIGKPEECVLYQLNINEIDSFNSSEYYKFLYDISKELYSIEDQPYINLDYMISSIGGANDGLPIKLEDLKILKINSKLNLHCTNIRDIDDYFNIGFGIKESKYFIQLLDKYNGRKYFEIEKIPKYSWVSISYDDKDASPDVSIEHEIINTSSNSNKYLTNQYVFKFI